MVKFYTVSGSFIIKELTGITMNLYVHMTEKEKEKEIKKFEQAFKIG